ncbi:MAG: hypothetical protein JSS90_09620 [Bacteroidetes bacterium]|jgi:hypothetical protein|nr:hypothetical protein [Bacteroidota bacterium]
MKLRYLILMGLIASASACKKEKDKKEPQLIFKVKLDPQQPRLDVFGNPAVMPAGHAAQNPDFNYVAIHSIELVPNKFTQFEQGDLVYSARNVMQNGVHAVVFDELKQLKNGDVVFTIPLSKVTPGSYEYIRSSVDYQNYNFNFRANGYDMTGTVGCFVGHNTLISSYTIKDKSVTVNGVKAQGYYGIEIPPIPPFYPGEVIEGQTPSTTVINPLNATSPLPAGSCTVTGTFPEKFIITGNETGDIVITLSFSTNNSFEWTDTNGNGILEPLDGEQVVDMGLRGLIPLVER